MNRTRRRPLGLLFGAVMAVVVGAVALGALFGTGDSARDRPAEADGSFAPAYDGVCDAAAAARDGDSARARAVFFDRSHQRLHELAALAQEGDRVATARLLEAKQRVEASLETSSPALTQDLESLAVAAGRAMTVAGAADPGPCPG